MDVVHRQVDGSTIVADAHFRDISVGPIIGSDQLIARQHLYYTIKKNPRRHDDGPKKRRSDHRVSCLTSIATMV